MNLQFHYQPYILNFKFNAGTSRGIMNQRKCWFVKLASKDIPTLFGLGEAAPIVGLSIDDISELELSLNNLATNNYLTVTRLNELLAGNEWRNLPSLHFAIETALYDLQNHGDKIIFKNQFSEGKEGIPINGLVWMDSQNAMQQQLQEKIAQGYKCIKIKVGAIDFNQELAIIKNLRREYSSQQIIIRLDANGAWSPQEALEKLERLSPYDIHSIEQPIAAGQRSAMRDICKASPIKIALDEELIGISRFEEKEQLLAEIEPQYIIIKPSLLGGFFHSDEWIATAERNNIDWWATSALESNIGLNAICQYTANKNIQKKYQGLGTGQLYHNNIESPLTINDGKIYLNKEKKWMPLAFNLSE